MSPRPTVRALLVLAFATPAARAQPTPVQFFQLPLELPVAGEAVDPTIGTFYVQSFDPPNGNGVRADLVFAPEWGWLDRHYDLRWVNVVTAQTLNGFPVAPGAGILVAPGVEPAPPHPGGAFFNDAKPFYFTDSEHAGCFAFGFGSICVPGASSTFIDARAGFPGGTVVSFATYLVLRSSTDPGLLSTDFQVLAGFTWTHAEPNSVHTILQVTNAPGAGDRALIEQALRNAAGNWPPGFGDHAPVAKQPLAPCIEATCFQVVGLAPANIPLHADDALLVAPLFLFALPAGPPAALAIPNHPALVGLHVYVQLGWYGPQLLTGDPVRMSQGHDVTLGAGAVPYGAASGVEASLVGAAAPGGTLRVRFVLDD